MSVRPRVNTALLNEYKDHTVTLIGKVDSIDASRVIFALNDGSVAVLTNASIPPLEIGSVYEVIGKVLNESEVKGYKASKLETTELPPPLFEQRLLALREGPAKKRLFVANLA